LSDPLITIDDVRRAARVFDGRIGNTPFLEASIAVETFHTFIRMHHLFSREFC
jgi:hypothetical protein